MKNKNGITLVSLVITIVIMLILAGVSISFVIGQNGLFTKSKQSAETYKISSDIEKIKNAWNEYVTDSTERDYTEELTLDAFKTYVTENNVLNVISLKEDKLNVKVNDKYYQVEKVGEGIEVNKIDKVDNRVYLYNDGLGVDNWDLVNTVKYGSAGDVSNVNNYLEFNIPPVGYKGIRVHSKQRYNTGSYTKLCVRYDIDARVNSNDTYSYFHLCMTGVEQSNKVDWGDASWYNDPSTKSIAEKGDASNRVDQVMTLDLSDIQNQDRYIVITDQGLHVKVHAVWFE